MLNGDTAVFAYEPGSQLSPTDSQPSMSRTLAIPAIRLWLRDSFASGAVTDAPNHRCGPGAAPATRWITALLQAAPDEFRDLLRDALVHLFGQVQLLIQNILRRQQPEHLLAEFIQIGEAPADHAGVRGIFG